MIYLATPYWHAEESVRLKRTHAAIYITRAFIRRGVPIFSPIAHAHALRLEFGDLPFTNKQWVDLDEGYIKHCSYMLVAQIDGWQESKGIEQEVLFCTTHGIPVTYMNTLSSNALIEAEASRSKKPESVPGL